MRKINVSMDTFGNTKEKEKNKIKEKEKKQECYYEDLTPSWQGSISALLLLFLLSLVFFCVGENISFVLEKVYLLWHKGLIILYIYSRSYNGFLYELSLKKLDTKNNLEAFQGVF